MRRGLVALLLLGLLLPPVRAADGSGEGNVKAAFVLNFMKFVEWPASAFGSPADPIVVSALGDDPVAGSLSALQGKTVSGRLVVVQMVPTLSELKRCHVLFVGASEKQRLGPVLRAVQGWPTLTISDSDGFAGRGGMIGFTRRDDRIAFEINDESARKAGLQVSAKLLYLGKSVREGPGGER
jgi:hypothetical protein